MWLALTKMWRFLCDTRHCLWRETICHNPLTSTLPFFNLKFPIEMTTTDFFSKLWGRPDSIVVSWVERLTISLHWIVGGKTYARHRRACLTKEFEKCYGQDGSILVSWQALCVDVHIEPVPMSITKRRKVTVQLRNFEEFRYWSRFLGSL